MTNEQLHESATAHARVLHADGVLEMRRVFRATREQVFDAWTRPEQFSQWFGPHGSTISHCTIDLRVGGELHFFIRVPADIDVWCKGVFQLVERPHRIVFTDHFSDAEGNIVERPGFPLETTIDVTFKDHSQGTEITLRQYGLVIDQGESEGWQQGFERLDDLLLATTTLTGEKR